MQKFVTSHILTTWTLRRKTLCAYEKHATIKYEITVN